MQLRINIFEFLIFNNVERTREIDDGLWDAVRWLCIYKLAIDTVLNGVQFQFDLIVFGELLLVLLFESVVRYLLQQLFVVLLHLLQSLHILLPNRVYPFQTRVDEGDHLQLDIRAGMLHKLLVPVLPVPV